MIIKVELLFKGGEQLLKAINENLVESIRTDFIEGEEKCIIKSVIIVDKNE